MRWRVKRGPSKNEAVCGNPRKKGPRKGKTKRRAIRRKPKRDPQRLNAKHQKDEDIVQKKPTPVSALIHAATMVKRSHMQV